MRCTNYTMVMKVLASINADPATFRNRLDVAAPLVFEQDAVLAPAECDAMIARAEQLGFSDAPITTARGFVMRPDVRNNTRAMFDDVVLAASLFDRIAPGLPPRLFDRRPVGVNERFRCYRYQPGQQFRPHYDGAFQRHDHECSELTFMIYLNASCTGGNTAFLDFDVEVVPEIGKALFFQHRLLHEGAVVTAGVKYVLRSDVMYAD